MHVFPWPEAKIKEENCNYRHGCKGKKAERRREREGGRKREGESEEAKVGRKKKMRSFQASKNKLSLRTSRSERLI